MPSARLLQVLVGTLLLFSCASSKKNVKQDVVRLRFAGEYILPKNTVFQGTKVGGLSGIDYNPGDDSYYLISDDRSDHNDARFYTAKIFFSSSAIDSVRFIGFTSLLQENGKPFPNRKIDSTNLPDPEALRLNRNTGHLVWSNEGERLIRDGYSLLQNPSVNVILKDGRFVEKRPLPANMVVKTAESGPRRNGVFEGLAFSPDFKSLWVSVEEPLYEDGPRASLNDSSAWIRIIRYDETTKNPVAQYAYKIDPIIKSPVPAGGFSINGVVDILALNDTQLLVTERSFSTGHIGCNVRVYIADFTEADNVAETASLFKTPPRKFAQKKLLFNLDALGRTVYNVEGATFGPLFPNGKRSLLFVTDNNFSDDEKTQFLLFEID